MNPSQMTRKQVNDHEHGIACKVYNYNSGTAYSAREHNTNPVYCNSSNKVAVEKVVVGMVIIAVYIIVVVLVLKLGVVVVATR